MAKLLFITANPNLEEQSYSLQLGKAFLESYKQANAEDEIVELDLYNMDIPLIDRDVLSAWGKLRTGADFAQLTAVEQAKVQKIDALTDQFVSADKYVFVTPLWNLGVPPQMKAYMDTFVIVGKTFKYTENGPTSLLSNKQVIHLQARGGFYSEGPASEMEFGDKHLRAVFNFLQMHVWDSIVAEGMYFNPAEAEAIMASALEKARQAGASFAQAAVTA